MNIHKRMKMMINYQDLVTQDVQLDFKHLKLKKEIFKIEV